jgi:hypothetical protein
MSNASFTQLLELWIRYLQAFLPLRVEYLTLAPGSRVARRVGQQNIPTERSNQLFALPIARTVPRARSWSLICLLRICTSLCLSACVSSRRLLWTKHLHWSEIASLAMAQVFSGIAFRTIPVVPATRRGFWRPAVRCLRVQAETKQAGHDTSKQPPQEIDPEFQKQIDSYRANEERAPRLTPAEELRTLISNEKYGTVCTRSGSGPTEGFPSGALTPFAVDDKGRFVCCLSNLSSHKKCEPEALT